MKDILIAIVILAVLTVLFSVYGTPPEQDAPSEPTHHADGTRVQGESEQIQQGKGDLPSIPEPPSPKTGYRWWWF